MQRFKTRSSDEIVALLITSERYGLAHIQDREGHKLWKRSFKGEPIKDEEMFWACIRYIHLNPVRARLCTRIIDYPWSSAQLFEECKWTEEHGIMEAI
ncbi:MAG: hypothetical protein ABL949_15565 [Fimbriimonadaceae bacterium]